MLITYESSNQADKRVTSSTLSRQVRHNNI